MRCNHKPLTALGAILVVGLIGLGAVHVTAGTTAIGPTAPQMRACLAAHQRVCNPSAEATRVANTQEAQPPSANPAYLSRTIAEARARAAALTPSSAAAPATVVVYSALMTRPDFDALTHESDNAAMNAQRKIWVVTVHAPMATDGSPSRAAEIKDVYSIALDAETGHWTDECIGCAWLHQNQ